MTLAKKLRNPFVQQYLIEIVFPLLGYFFFDWDILIIGVYYLIDHLCSQLLFFRRAYWVNNKGSQQFGIHLLIISILAFILFFGIETIGFGYMVMDTQIMTFDMMWDSFIVFFKEELWVLIPVVLFVYHFKDQFTFYMPRRYLNFEFKSFVFWDLISGLIVLVLLSLGGLLWVKFNIHNAIVIFIFVAVKITYDLTIRKLVLKRSLKPNSNK